MAQVLDTPVRKRASKKPAAETAAPLIPANPTYEKLRKAAAGCKACPLWKRGTQTVFGEGKSTATVMSVVEQPGDKEDIAGRPFVGPAGLLLDRALQRAGIDRNEVYVTNAVKHFKWEPRGKRRIHKKPRASEIHACRTWLDSEIEVIRPEVIVCLGATAAHSLIGAKFSVKKHRGDLVDSNLAPKVTATVHPSSLLRLPPEADREAEMEKFVADLKKVAGLIRPRLNAA